MRIVPDTNQAGLIYPHTHGDGVSLAPYVLAELLLNSNPKPRLHLASMPIRLGLEPAHVIKALSSMDEEDISTFEPFHGEMLPNYECYKELLGAMSKPVEKHLKWARSVKDNNRNFCCEQISRSQDFRKCVRDMVSPGKFKSVPKFNSSKQLIDMVGSTEGSFLGELVVSSVSSGGKRRCRVEDPKALFKAVMGNQYLGGFFTVLLCYLISFSQAWAHSLRKLNFEPSKGRDDWTDMTLPLYAGRGDCIVTRDTKLKDILVVAFSEDEVIVKTAEELYVTLCEQSGT